jgi:hypothetical protein
MTTKATVNGRTWVHKKSDGFSIAFPDACKLPNGVSVPFVNIAFSKDAAGTAASVFSDGEPVMTAASCFSTSYGDEPGLGGGVISGCIQGKASFVNFSVDVIVEGEPVPRQFDPMIHNHGSPFNGYSPQEFQPSAADYDDERGLLCEAFCFCAYLGGNDACMNAVLGDLRTSGRERAYDPRFPGILPQVAFRMEPPPPQPIMSGIHSQRWGDGFGGTAELPSSYWSWGSRRPDVITLWDPTLPPTRDNIKEVYECKFKNRFGIPDIWRDGQEAAYRQISPSGDVNVLTEEACGCVQDDYPIPIPPPIPVPFEKPETHYHWKPIPVNPWLPVYIGLGMMMFFGLPVPA